MIKHHVHLSAADRHYLESRLAKGTLKARVFKRATGLLELDPGKTLQAVAETLGVNSNTVAAWRERYQRAGLSGLADAPRSGRPVKIDGVQPAKITALACSQAPTGHGRWALRLLADKAVELGYCEHLSHSQARMILKKRPPAAPQENLVHRRDRQPVSGADGTTSVALCPAL